MLKCDFPQAASGSSANAADTPFAKSLGARVESHRLRLSTSTQRRGDQPQALHVAIETNRRGLDELAARFEHLRGQWRLIDQVQFMPALPATAASNSCEARVGSKTWPSHSRIVGILSPPRQDRVQLLACRAVENGNGLSLLARTGRSQR